jgi:serine/threonine protein kinase
MLPGFSESARDLLTKLLMIDPEQRIGFSNNDAKEIMQHEFFNTIDWESLEKQEV